MAEQNSDHHDKAESEIRKVELKRDLSDIIYKAGDEKNMLAMEVIDVLIDLQKEMIDIILNPDEDEQEQVEETT